DCLLAPELAAGEATTEFIPRHFAKPAAPAPDDAALALAAVLWFEASARRHGHDPARTWSSSGALAWPLKLEAGGKAVARSVTVLGPRRYRIGGGDSPCELSLAAAGDGGAVRFSFDAQERSAEFAFAGDILHCKLGPLDLAVRETLYAPPASAGAAGGSDTELRAPMNGKVVAVLVAEGDAVEKGQRLVVVEAMKMQHEMTAQAAGRVARLAVKPGDQVATRQLLVELTLAQREA